MRYWIFLAIAAIWFGAFAASTPAEEAVRKIPFQASAPVPKQVGGKPDGFFPQANFTFEEVLEGAVVMHSFVLQNRGDAPLEVKQVKTS